MRKPFFYLLLGLNLGIILWFWYGNSGPLLAADLPSALIAWGRLAGLLAAFSVLLQFTLIGRNVWIERTFGLDRLAHLHHWTGFSTIFFVLLHPLLIVNGYALLNGTDILGQVSDFFSNYEDVFQAFLALLLLVGVVFLSLYIARRRMKYETWYLTHLSVYAAVALAFGHQLKNGGDFLASPLFTAYWYALYAAVFGSLLIFRFLRPMWLYRKHGFRIDRAVPEGPGATSVYIRGERMDEFKVRPGQFLMFRPLLGKWVFQNHPFSASMMPRNGELRFTAKRVGDFTTELPGIPAGTPVIVDGPFGVFTPEDPEGRKFLFIAGGIGITPIRTILEFLPSSADSVLLYGNRSERDIVFREELDAIAVGKKMAITHVLSEDPGFSGEKGRIDLPRIERLVPDFKEREIFICGPKPMLLGLRKALGGAGVPRGKIRFERFSLH